MLKGLENAHCIKLRQNNSQSKRQQKHHVTTTSFPGLWGAVGPVGGAHQMTIGFGPAPHLTKKHQLCAD